MSRPLDRREILKKCAWGSLVIGAGGATTSVVPAWAEAAAAQGTPPRAGIPRIIFSRASLQHGIVPFSGETAMDLYHNHPHVEKEEVVQPEDIRLQTRLTMRNHKEILDWMGLGWKNVVKLTRFQKRLEESKQIEEVLASYFRDSWPPMTVYEIDGLSSPQARLEIEIWVVPDGPGVETYTTPGAGQGNQLGLPQTRSDPSHGLRAGRNGQQRHGPGVHVGPHRLSVRRRSVESRQLQDARRSRGTCQAGDGQSRACNPGRRHHLATPDLPGQLHRSGRRWRSVSGQAGRLALLQHQPAGDGHRRARRQRSLPDDRGRAAPRPDDEGADSRARTTARPARDVARSGHQGQQRCGPHLLFRNHRVPIDVDPWNPGSFTLPPDAATQEKMLANNVERTLKAAGITWQHIVLLARTGEAAGLSSMTDRMGDWRPCRTTRAVASGVPGAKVLCDITAVAGRPRR